MKLIIDIPNEVYKTLSELSEKEKINELSYYDRIIANGTPYEERTQGDLISREALKHRFAQITYVRFTADMGQGGFEMFSEKEIEDIIDKAPSVEIATRLQQTQGEWIQAKDEDGIEIYRKNLCSRCNKASVEKYSFCPNCGVKMQKGGAKE